MLKKTDMWKRLFEDCNKMQNEEIECLTRKYKERLERLALKTAVERTIPARDIPCGQSPMELLTPRELSQTTEVRVPTAVGRVTIPDPSVTIGDPVVEQTVQKFKCAVLTVCTVPMSSRTLTPTGRKHNKKVIRWNNTVKNLASRNAGRMILMDLEHELRAMDQARFTTDGVHFDSIEGQARMYRVFQERLDELEVELFDTGVLRREETTNEPAISTFVPPNLETRLGSVSNVPQLPQSSSEPGQRMNVLDRLGEAQVRRTIHSRR